MGTIKHAIHVALEKMRAVLHNSIAYADPAAANAEARKAFDQVTADHVARLDARVTAMERALVGAKLPAFEPVTSLEPDPAPTAVGVSPPAPALPEVPAANSAAAVIGATTVPADALPGGHAPAVPEPEVKLTADAQ